METNWLSGRSNKNTTNPTISMEIETGVEVFAIIHLGTVGISHILAHRTWARFFIWLRSREEPGVFVVAFLSLGMGSIIVAFHPVWTGIPLVLTLFGWSQVLKAVIPRQRSRVIDCLVRI